MGLIPTDSTGSSQGGTHPKHLQPWLASPTSLWGQSLCDATPLTRLSPLQCLEELAASVEEVLEALGDRVLPALGLVLAGLCEVESRGCCGVTPKAAPTAWGEALWAPQLLVPQQVTPGALGSRRAPRDHRVLQTHRGTRSAGGRSSPGPAGGPELQPGPCAAGPGRRTPSSLRGQSQRHPLTPLSMELLPTPRHLLAPQHHRHVLGAAPEPPSYFSPRNWEGIWEATTRPRCPPLTHRAGCGGHFWGRAQELAGRTGPGAPRGHRPPRSEGTTEVRSKVPPAPTALNLA